ncbi:unnamed protein product [Cylindrotheca closterium]|uniref:RING-type domain-containing protein n=1 Tax=Cylindrotheca closterium TaxID=2856 RepID=A0AAD2FY35_9STRA|nr:unnamed protein product [Cylindrotheca closterium]
MNVIIISSPILLFLLTISGSNAQDPILELSIPPSSVPTSSVATSTTIRPSVSQIPTIAAEAAPTTSLEPTLTNKPSVSTSSPTWEVCGNTQGWYTEDQIYYNCRWNIVKLSCDDDRVECWYLGPLGYAAQNCCRCKFECEGQCNDPIHVEDPSSNDDQFSCLHGGSGSGYNNGGYYDYTDDDLFSTDGSDTAIIAILLSLLGLACCARLFYNNQGQRPARREVQQTMTARRQQYRANNTSIQGLTEEEQNHARYEQFVTSFYFQTVLSDKSNITADSLRNSAFSTTPKPNEDEGHHSSPAANDHDDDDDDASKVDGTQGRLSRRLSSWRNPSARDECCICLECYAAGETICAPITTECNHVFHEGCINEWLTKNDKCPLCRVELLKD